MSRVWEDVKRERERQDKKWGSPGPRNLDHDRWSLILQEEMGEVAMAILDNQTESEVYAELVQVAAVAVAWLEAMEWKKAQAPSMEGRVVPGQTRLLRG